MPHWAEHIGNRRPRRTGLRPPVGAVSTPRSNPNPSPTNPAPAGAVSTPRSNPNPSPQYSAPVGAVSDRQSPPIPSPPSSPESRVPSPGHQHGFTLLELVIVITLVILLFLTAWNRLMPLRGDAEAAHVIAVVGNLQSALGMVATEKVMHDGLEALPDLADTNPMALLQQTPDHYIGTQPGEIPPGAWYFDEASATLRYRVRFPQYLAGAPQAPAELAWRIRVTGDDQPTGVRLAAQDDNPHWPGHSRALRELASVAPNDDPSPAQ